MIKVNNDRVVIEFTKNGKVVKSLDFKNRLTNLYLDYIASEHLGETYYEATNVFTFPLAYIKFDTTQTITDSSTTMLFDVKSFTQTNDDVIVKVGQNNKRMTSSYSFDLTGVPNGSIFKGIGFGQDNLENADYLFSFIDLSMANITTDDTIGIGITRIDEITTDEHTTSGNFLPFSDNVNAYAAPLTEIWTEFEDGNIDKYDFTQWREILGNGEAVVDFNYKSESCIRVGIDNISLFQLGDMIRITNNANIVVAEVVGFTNTVDNDPEVNDAIFTNPIIPFVALPPTERLIQKIEKKLIKTRVSAGKVSITGFKNYYIGSGLFPVQENTTTSSPITGTTITLPNSNGTPLIDYSLDCLSTQASRSGYNHYVNAENLHFNTVFPTAQAEDLASYDGYNNVIHIKSQVNYCTLKSNIMGSGYTPTAGSKVTVMALLKKGTSNVGLYFGNNVTTGYIGVTKYQDVDSEWAYYYATYTFKADATVFTPVFHFQTNGEVYIAKLQVSLGDTLRPYEPFGIMPSPDFPSPILSSGDEGAITLIDGTNSTPITLPVGMVGASLPNGVKDTITDTLFTKRVGKVVLNGSENWTRRTDVLDAQIGATRMCFKNNDVPANRYVTGTTNLYCDRFIPKTAYEMSENIRVLAVAGFGETITIDRARIGWIAGDSDAVAATKFKTWLASNNTTVLYELATPITYANTTSVPTLSPTTVLTSSNAVKPTITGVYTIGDLLALYPSDTLYPTTNGAITKFHFIYRNDIFGVTAQTYINIQDLDISYQDTEMSIDLKIERGDY